MTPNPTSLELYSALVEKAAVLTGEIKGFSAENRTEARKLLSSKRSKDTREVFTSLLLEVDALLAAMASATSGPVQISLSHSHSIAQFFAFKFVHQPRLPLSELQGSPFFGSGIYSIYYVGTSFGPYSDLSKTETPIYVGKASPKDSYAETTTEQGTALFGRLIEHSRNMVRADLNLSDFEYRCASVQSGLQDTVEGFMIKLFRPIWNQEVKVAYGIGKHGDDAKTRANKRSPWDTLHPGRKWAAGTTEDQLGKDQIVKKIQAHLVEYPPFPDLEMLLKTLTEV